MNQFSFSKTILSYQNPLSVRGTYITENEFLVVEFQDKKLFLSVLPGFHQSTLNEVKFMLERFLPKASFQLPLISSQKGLGLIPKEELPSLDFELLFYLENAFFYFHSSEKSFNIHSNALSSLKDERTDFESDCVKIKFQSFDNALLLKEKMIQALTINPQLKFRIDANRTFELRELIQLQEFLLKDIALDHFDYFEEPLKNSSDLITYQKHSDILYALDETFHYSPLWSLKYFSHLPIVLKPSLLGISKTAHYLENYPQTRFIVSSSYEHSSALLALKFLGNFRPDEFHGLSSVVSDKH